MSFLLVLLAHLDSNIVITPLNVFLCYQPAQAASCMILLPLNASAQHIPLTGVEICAFLVHSQNIGKPLIKDACNVLLNNIGTDNFKFA